MMTLRLTAILRHNTTMPGDGDLAFREWTALVGAVGIPLDESGLALTLPLKATTIMPRLAKSFPWVAVTWPNATVEQAARLLRRSAFVQEAFIESSDADALLVTLEEQVGTAVTMSSRFSKPMVVALAHNYIIESEGALPLDIAKNRVSITVRALLEPYQLTRETALSRKLRAAKKTTLSLSHDLHIYKAKFFPRMVRSLINIYGSSGAVFDPYCGSGTALLEAALLGQDAIGVDIDPICEMISRSKVSPFIGSCSDVRLALETFREVIRRREQTTDFCFPEELKNKIARRDRLDDTDHLQYIIEEVNILAAAVRSATKIGVAADLVRTLASDAVTKKIRYRFVGVGNGRYTIEIVKQSLLERLDEKIERALQLIDVFSELAHDLKISFGDVIAAQADARSKQDWPELPKNTFVVTSPPYLPASSGREHYASSRALAFAVLGFSASKYGYFESTVRSGIVPSFEDMPEANRLMNYLFSDADENADPQRDAMRFERKAVPTAHYLADIGKFSNSLKQVTKSGRLALVVADQHTFYSHRRSEVEHIVSCSPLYGEIMGRAELRLVEEIKLQLLKSSASRAKPRAKDDYHEAVLIFEWTAAKEKEQSALNEASIKKNAA